MNETVQIPPAQRTKFPRNNWYAAASCEEVGQKPFSRMLLGEEVLLFRTEDGTPRALSGRCPHRGFRLSMEPSRREGDKLVCGYHGLSFDASGACVRVPFQNQIPDQMRLKSFPVAERRFFVWIWMGDPKKADPALIPELVYPTEGYNKRMFFSYEVAANYQLWNENLLDFSHAIFLHSGVADNTYDDNFNYLPPTYSIDNHIVKSSRLFEGIMPEPLLAKVAGLTEGQAVTRTVEVRLHAPVYISILDSYRLTEDLSRIVSEQVMEVPSTPTSENNLISWANAYSNRDISAPELRDQYWITIMQDKVAMEETQKSLDIGGDKYVEVSLRQDTPALRSRRIIAEMVAAEAAA